MHNLMKLLKNSFTCFNFFLNLNLFSDLFLSHFFSLETDFFLSRISARFFSSFLRDFSITFLDFSPTEPLRSSTAIELKKSITKWDRFITFSSFFSTIPRVTSNGKEISLAYSSVLLWSFCSLLWFRLRAHEEVKRCCREFFFIKSRWERINSTFFFVAIKKNFLVGAMKHNLRFYRKNKRRTFFIASDLLCSGAPSLKSYVIFNWNFSRVIGRKFYPAFIYFYDSLSKIFIDKNGHRRSLLQLEVVTGKILSSLFLAISLIFNRWILVEKLLEQSVNSFWLE